MNKITRLAAALVLSGLLLAAPAAQAAPSLLGQSSNFELEVSEMELEITADDPRPKAYLYTGGQSDYYFIVWMSSNPTVATVDGDGRVTGRSAGEATISAITDRGEYAACRVTVRKESGDAASKKPALDHVTLNLIIQYDNAHPSQKLQLINTSGSFIYAYQWMTAKLGCSAFLLLRKWLKQMFLEFLTHTNSRILTYELQHYNSILIGRNLPAAQINLSIIFIVLYGITQDIKFIYIVD